MTAWFARRRAAEMFVRTNKCEHSGRWRRYEVITRLTLPAGKPAQAWVPLPSVSEVAWTRPLGNTWTTNAATAEVARDPHQRLIIEARHINGVVADLVRETGESPKIDASGRLQFVMGPRLFASGRRHPALGPDLSRDAALEGRGIPKDLPPRSTTSGYFSRWRDAGLFGQINHHLVMADRERVGREASPSAAVLDS